MGDALRAALVSEFGFTDLQAEAVLGMQVSRFSPGPYACSVRNSRTSSDPSNISAAWAEYMRGQQSTWMIAGLGFITSGVVGILSISVVGAAAAFWIKLFGDLRYAVASVLFAVGLSGAGRNHAHPRTTTLPPSSPA